MCAQWRAPERGQVLPLVAVVVVVAGLACFALGRVGAAAVHRARAAAAADAAALAGATAGDDAATALAQANGGRVVRLRQRGADTVVEVQVGAAQAAARARGGPVDAGRAVQLRGLAPALRAALSRAAALLNGPVPITSGVRTRAEQAALYARRGSNPYPVAPPGSSRHELGLAVDVPAWFAPRLAGVAHRAGLCRPYPATDPVHFELCPAPP